MMKKLTKGIEESKKEKERLAEEKEKSKEIFKEIEQKAFIVQENYKKTQEVLPSCIFGYVKLRLRNKMHSIIYLFNVYIVCYTAWGLLLYRHVLFILLCR